jgi:pyridoxal 5'-phosphate synthase subunit Pdx1
MELLTLNVPWGVFSVAFSPDGKTIAAGTMDGPVLLWESGAPAGGYEGRKAGAAATKLVEELHKTEKLPVVNFAAGGVATPADAALMMQLGADGVFVGSGIFKSSNPAVRAKAIVRATTHFQNAEIIAEVSKNLGEAMPGLDIKQIPAEELLAQRGW